MNFYTFVGLAVGLVVGVFVGYQAGSSVPGHVDAPPAVQMPAQAGDNYQTRIATLQQVVAREPKNAKAWAQLGNDYYDTRQPQKAIEAYDRALELDPKNPDILTDQGTMYRSVGQYQKAIANFEKANRIAPKHVQSLFNIGVVYASDLKSPDKATAAWKKVIEVAPQSPQAAQASVAIEEMKRSAPPSPAK